MNRTEIFTIRKFRYSPITLSFLLALGVFRTGTFTAPNREFHERKPPSHFGCDKPDRLLYGWNLWLLCDLQFSVLVVVAAAAEGSWSSYWIASLAFMQMNFNLKRKDFRKLFVSISFFFRVLVSRCIYPGFTRISWLYRTKIHWVWLDNAVNKVKLNFVISVSMLMLSGSSNINLDSKVTGFCVCLRRPPVVLRAPLHEHQSFKLLVKSILFSLLSANSLIVSLSRVCVCVFFFTSSIQATMSRRLVGFDLPWPKHRSKSTTHTHKSSYIPNTNSA